MQIAVLSDIHSNYNAFYASVNYAINKGIENFLFLGDYVSDCAYPQKTMKLLYDLKEKYNCWFIRGNREEYLLNHRDAGNDGWKAPSSATGSLLYTYENLTNKDLEFFNQLKISGHMKLDGYPEFLYCHGSLENSKGNLNFGSENANNTMKDMKTDLIICGHTHQQGIYKYCNKTLINVGSVGIPWNYNGDAQFGILYGKHKCWEIELIQLSYDKEKAVAELYESGLNKMANVWVKLVEETLMTGVDRSMDCLLKALHKCEKKEGASDWSNLSEEYWEAAAKEMGYI